MVLYVGPLRQVLEPQSEGASLWDPLFFLTAADMPLAWAMCCPDMVLVGLLRDLFPQGCCSRVCCPDVFLAWWTEAVALLGLQTCGAGWPRCRLQEQCRCGKFWVVWYQVWLQDTLVLQYEYIGYPNCFRSSYHLVCTGRRSSVHILCPQKRPPPPKQSQPQGEMRVTSLSQTGKMA